ALYTRAVLPGLSGQGRQPVHRPDRRWGAHVRLERREVHARLDAVALNARAGVVALGLLAGCAGGPIVIPLRDETAGARPPVTRPPSPPCRVTVAAVEDERAKRGTVRAIGNRPRPASDGPGRIRHRV